MKYHTVHFPISEQIKSLFAKKNFYRYLSYQFQRCKLQEESYEDVYDGSLYKQFTDSASGILNDQKNISLAWNVFKSSQFSIWPIYFLSMNCHTK